MVFEPPAARGVMDVGRILRAAEAAAPVDAIEQAARELGLAFDAVSVSFLIADLSGRALVRLAHVPLKPGALGDRASSGLGNVAKGRSRRRCFPLTVARPSRPSVPRPCRSSRQ